MMMANDTTRLLTRRTTGDVLGRRLKKRVLSLAIACALGTIPPAFAKDHTSASEHFHQSFGPTHYAILLQDTHKQLAQNARRISKSRAASIAMETYGGKVLKISDAGQDYRVKLLQNNGRIKIVVINGKSGEAKQ